MPVDPKLIKKVFQWGTMCTKNCQQKLTAIIAEWPEGEKPSQLVSPDSMVGEGKLGTVVARKGMNENYELLVHVHNADAIGKQIDPTKKWGKLFNMGGIPGIGIGSRLSRGVSNTGSAVGSGVAAGASTVGFVAMCAATAGFGPGCAEAGQIGRARKTRKRMNRKNKNKNKKSRRN